MARNYYAPKVFMQRLAKTRTTTVSTRLQRCGVRGVIIPPALRSSAGLLAVAAIVLSACSDAQTASPGAPPNPGQTFATTAQVRQAVRAAQIVDLPSSVGFLTKSDSSRVQGQFDCHSVDGVPANVVDPNRTVFGQCASGADHGTSSWLHSEIPVPGCGGQRSKR